MRDDSPFIAEAADVDHELEPPPPPRRRPEARRALGTALCSLFLLGFILGPLAISLGRRARLAAVGDGELEGLAAARAAIALGRLGMALHLTLAATLLPWLLFVPALGASPGP